MLIPHATLVLVIDGSRMQLLRNRGTDASPDLEVVEEDRLDNPATHVLGTEAPGRAHESSGGAHHSYAAPDLHQRREDRFAQGAVESLCRKAAGGVPVVVIAPPIMLGTLRAAYGDRLRDQILLEVDKDLTRRKAGEITMFLHDFAP